MSSKMYLVLCLGVITGMRTAQGSSLPKTTDSMEGEHLLPVAKAQKIIPPAPTTAAYTTTAHTTSAHTTTAHTTTAHTTTAHTTTAHTTTAHTTTAHTTTAHTTTAHTTEAHTTAANTTEKSGWMLILPTLFPPSTSATTSTPNITTKANSGWMLIPTLFPPTTTSATISTPNITTKANSGWMLIPTLFPPTTTSATTSTPKITTKANSGWMFIPTLFPPTTSASTSTSPSFSSSTLPPPLTSTPTPLTSTPPPSSSLAPPLTATPSPPPPSSSLAAPLIATTSPPLTSTPPPSSSLAPPLTATPSPPSSSLAPPLTATPSPPLTSTPPPSSSIPPLTTKPSSPSSAPPLTSTLMPPFTSTPPCSPQSSPNANISCAILKINETSKSTEFATNLTSDSKIDTSLNMYAGSSADVAGNMTMIDKLSNQVRIILKHFQGPEPIGIPGQTILTEPLHAPDTNASLVLATGYFHNITIWGLSNFTINTLNTKLDDMEVYVELLIKRVLVEGNYTVSNMLSSSEGPFNITLINVTAIATIDLASNEEGKLYSNHSVLDMAYKSLEVDLKEVSTLLKPFVNTGGVAVLNAEKQHILANVNERLIMEIDRRLAAFPRIPSLKHLSPVDLAILEAKKFVASRFEPYIISNVIDFENPFIKIHAGPVTVHGISRFARVGNVTLAMANETVIIRLRIVTGRLQGNCKWFYDFGSVGVKRYGDSNFTVDHVQFEATIHQNVDSRRPPKLHDLEIETGPIRVHMDGRGHFDYLVEMVVKILPKMLRYTIIDALEEPLKHKIQSELFDKISVDKVVEENMNDIKKYLADKL